jgi:hypothetical protein
VAEWEKVASSDTNITIRMLKDGQVLSSSPEAGTATAK